MFKLLLGAAAGFAAAWFMDPNDGTRRRNTTRDRALSYARKGKDQAASQASQVAGQVKGAATKAAPFGGREDAAERLNDPALARKVESEAFRSAGVDTGAVSVNVESGVVYLRGEVADAATAERLTEAARAVEGVTSVESLLHTPGEPAPMKS
jgi:osmotically-inducible protein OsmY